MFVEFKISPHFVVCYLITSIMSLKFLPLLYDIMGGSGKHSLTSGFTCSIFQLDLNILLISEADPEGGEGGSSPGQILNP